MLGVFDDFKLKFVKQYLTGHSLIKDALDECDMEVKSLRLNNWQLRLIFLRS